MDLNFVKNKLLTIFIVFLTSVPTLKEEEFYSSVMGQFMGSPLLHRIWLMC